MRKFLRNLLLIGLGKFKSPQPGIHVINSHYVTSSFPNYNRDKMIFERFLKYLSSQGFLINIEKGMSMILNKESLEKKTQFILTFDDGFEECYTVIAPLLEKYGCRGIFFLNANYIDSDLSYQRQFNKRIHLTTKAPMSWDQVIDLHKRGHIIGSHTLDHYNLCELSTIEIKKQIFLNKEVLEKRLNYNCDYFAWTYGRMSDFPTSALLEAENHHKYIFSSANYKSYFSINNRIINRRHLEPFWPNSHINYFLSAKKK